MVTIRSHAAWPGHPRVVRAVLVQHHAGKRTACATLAPVRAAPGALQPACAHVPARSGLAPSCSCSSQSCSAHQLLVEVLGGEVPVWRVSVQLKHPYHFGPPARAGPRGLAQAAVVEIRPGSLRLVAIAPVAPEGPFATRPAPPPPPAQTGVKPPRWVHPVNLLETSCNPAVPVATAPSDASQTLPMVWMTLLKPDRSSCAT